MAGLQQQGGSGAWSPHPYQFAAGQGGGQGVGGGGGGNGGGGAYEGLFEGLNEFELMGGLLDGYEHSA